MHCHSLHSSEMAEKHERNKMISSETQITTKSDDKNNESTEIAANKTYDKLLMQGNLMITKNNHSKNKLHSSSLNVIVIEDSEPENDKFSKTIERQSKIIRTVKLLDNFNSNDGCNSLDSIKLNGVSTDSSNKTRNEVVESDSTKSKRGVKRKIADEPTHITGSTKKHKNDVIVISDSSDLGKMKRNLEKMYNTNFLAC